MSTMSSSGSHTNDSKRHDFSPKAGMAEIKSDLGQVRQDLGKLKDDTVATVSSAAHSAVESAKQGVDVAKDYADQAGDHLRDGYDSMCSFVKERPAASILIALGVGAIAARLISWRK